MPWADRLDEDWDRSSIAPLRYPAPPLPTLDVPPAPGRWTKPPPSLKRRRGVLTLVFGLIGYLGVGVIVGTHGWPHVFASLPFQAMLYAGLMRLGLSKVPRPEDLRLLEDPDDPDVCLVSLRVVCAGKTTGRDRGIAWFEDGRLLYSGHRTSFALGGEDIALRGEHRTYAREFGGILPDEAVPLRTDGTKVVFLKPLARKSDIGNRQEMRFLKALYAFKRNPPHSRGPRQWPPLEPWIDDCEGGVVDARKG